MGDELEELRGTLAAANQRNAELEAEVARTREHQQLLTSILHHAPDFLTHITPDGYFLFLNRFAPGFDPAELIGRTVYDFTDPAYHDDIRATIARVIATKSPQAYETMGGGENREPTPYFTRVAPILGDDGRVESLVLIATDVSRLKQAESAYAESQAMLRHVLTATGMGTWWWNPERDEGGHDAATAEIFGFGDDECGTSVALMSRVHPDDLERVQAGLGNAHEAGDYGPIEHRIVRPDGSVRWVNASGRLLKIGDGTRLVGGVIDITERKRLEAQLGQAQKMESIGRLAGGIAHDFNNMLTAILSYNHFALSAVPQGSRIAHDLGEVKRAAERSAALTSQLLAFARQQHIEPKVTDLNAIVLRVESLLHRVLGANIEVTTKLAARGRVKVDINQFEQVLLNLTTNARDAMPRGGRLAIETTDLELDHGAGATHPELAPGAYVMLSVSDTGAGIAPHLLSRVFEPFFTTKDQGKGTGLGLATCYGIVAQNHGHITVESDPGRRTTFRVYLPLSQAEPARAEPPVPSHPVTGHETILVVEDEPHVRAVTIKTLEQIGFRVLAATDGVEALSLGTDHAGPIDLLLTDIVMPQLGGTELAQLLSRTRPELAVLFVSGYTDNALQRRLLEGEVDLLEKPFSPSMLALRVRQALDRRPARP